ncbi:aminoacyl-histidine dipeptidase [Thorsellia kenyensis]|uniref:Aminoacyl-histidine dipeptidase n=1 Tax=Thorsellia kenyensis TaxID=1549888 RepID=A0ABV6CBI9_9GAMM
MKPITQLTPSRLWEIFNDICKIPRPSHQEEAITKQVESWAKEYDIECLKDDVGNLLLKKPASKGFENKKTVVLQAHLDMVAQKRENSPHDFSKDPILPQIVDGWVKATDTTLGADNGIGMASALAVLFDPSVSHGPIEVLLTASEETGMVGAFGLKPNWLNADIMINTDAEEEGDVYVGCAGGTDVVLQLPISRVAKPEDQEFYELTLQGLKGGHSGIDIHKGLGNANKLLAEVLFSLNNQFAINLASFNGGSLRNAIPRSASALLSLTKEQKAKIDTFLIDHLNKLKTIYHIKAPNLSLTLQPLNAINESIFDKKTTSQFINLINAHPNGVIRMSDAAQGVTETSLNLGVISTQTDHIEIISLVRSLVDAGKYALVNELKSLAGLVGAQFTTQSDYPGWAPDMHSDMLSVAKEKYADLFGMELKTMVIHAGLECGLIKKPYPNLDIISIGPTIKGAHSPDERVDIKSVEKYWQFLISLLKAIPDV